MCEAGMRVMSRDMTWTRLTRISGDRRRKEGSQPDFLCHTQIVIFMNESFFSLIFFFLLEFFFSLQINVIIITYFWCVCSQDYKIKNNNFFLASSLAGIMMMIIIIIASPVEANFNLTFQSSHPLID